ncbi:hypothetical protein CICLE_v10003075mg [Citrus x clementina]|uniref:Uncharacterized protein n=1 Tax=Citrus clementina TaxID=85681 RepID=V4UZU5_CITCL|nr:hypothetical protein CICLE_v10003075mg [Citrus x clementina]
MVIGVLVLVPISSYFPEKACNLFTSRFNLLLKMDGCKDLLAFHYINVFDSKFVIVSAGNLLILDYI